VNALDSVEVWVYNVFTCQDGIGGCVLTSAVHTTLTTAYSSFIERPRCVPPAVLTGSSGCTARAFGV